MGWFVFGLLLCLAVSIQSRGVPGPSIPQVFLPPDQSFNFNSLRICAFNIQVFGVSKMSKPHVVDILERVGWERWSGNLDESRVNWPLCDHWPYNILRTINQANWFSFNCLHWLSLHSLKTWSQISCDRKIFFPVRSCPMIFLSAGGSRVFFIVLTNKVMAMLLTHVTGSCSPGRHIAARPHHILLWPSDDLKIIVQYWRIYKSSQRRLWDDLEMT